MKEADNIEALLAQERLTEEAEIARDIELVRVGNQLAKLVQFEGWEVLKYKVQELRGELAGQLLERGTDKDVEFIRGQADGAKRVLDLVENAIQGAQEALRRVQVGRKGSYREASASVGLVGE